MRKLTFKTASIALLFLATLQACSIVPVASSARQNRLEPFIRGADYDYALPALERASSYLVELSNEGFSWPALATAADTAFLEIHIAAADSPDPALVVSAGSNALKQYFEQAGQGRRYLDVSPLLRGNVQSGDRVRLLNEGVSWETGKVTLVTFSNPPLAERRVFVLAPHPDDAEIAAYGIYQSSVADVVTVTAGDAGGKNFDSLWIDEGEHYRAKGRIRTLDSLVVPLLAGLRPESIRNLGYYDATLLKLWQAQPGTVTPPLAALEDPAYYRSFNFDQELRERDFESSWSALVSDLLQELERIVPETIVAPHPMLDRHGDHKFAALALFEAMNQWQGEAEVLLYTNHAVGNEAYPIGPRDGMMGLPAWNAGNLHLLGLYSHPLSAEDRRRKLIALEAMHDLRPFDPRDGGEVIAINPMFDYFRRGPRPNEVFFVTDVEGAREMHRALIKLADWMF